MGSVPKSRPPTRLESAIIAKGSSIFPPIPPRHRIPPIADISMENMYKELEAVERAIEGNDDLTISVMADEDVIAPFVVFLNSQGVEMDAQVRDTVEKYLDASIPIILKEKFRFRFPRPFKFKDLDRPYISTTGDTPSYPSGHSLQSRFAARMLSRFYPQYHNQLMEIGERIGWGRVQMGVHFPQDHYAGRRLGDYLHLVTKVE